MTEKCIPDLTPLGYPGGGKTTPARLARRVKRSYRTSLYCAGLFLIGGATCVAGGVALGDLPLHIMGAAMAYTGIVFLATACIGRDQYTLVQMTAREGGAAMTENALSPVLETLAALEHEQWVSWSRSLAATEHLSEARVERWQRLWVPYADLSEQEKEADREWARRVLEILAARGKEA